MSEPSVEALGEQVRAALRVATTIGGNPQREKQALAALDSLIAAWERAERERDDWAVRADERQVMLSEYIADLEAALTRAQKAEAVVEAAREADRHFAKELPPAGTPWRPVRAALTAYDEPPTGEVLDAKERVLQRTRDAYASDPEFRSKVDEALGVYTLRIELPVDEPPTEQAT